MTCCGDGFEEYIGRYVATSALGGIGQLVLYHLSRLSAVLIVLCGSVREYHEKVEYASL